MVDVFFFLRIRRPPRSTLLPYPTLFGPRHEPVALGLPGHVALQPEAAPALALHDPRRFRRVVVALVEGDRDVRALQDRKSTRLNSSHANTSYAVFCLTTKTARPWR